MCRCSIRPTRRGVLKSSALFAGIGLAMPSRVIRAATSSLSAPAGRVEPLPAGSVRLKAGIFKAQEETNAHYLDSLAVDRLLHTFRLTAGLPTHAKPYLGWEDPNCELRGHFAGGHYLSAVALASAYSGNSVLKARGDELVAGLAECQKKIGTGYVSAYPTDLFEKLAQGKPAWAPFYTYHKILAGLLDMYQLTGNTEALAVAEGMAGWVQDYFWPIGTEQRQRMLRTEYGGMNEVLVNLAAVTGKDRYIETARIFEQPVFLDPLAERRDELQGLHANTHLPKVIGAARMYEVAGDPRYRRITEYFLEEVLTARSYAIGNTSVDEFWKSPPGHLEGSLAWANAECCVAYNLMKLDRLAFGWTEDARWMDAYERSLFNARLGTQNAQGLKQYFFPLAAGYWRAYNSAEESFWCCTGTGAEEFAKFADTIYFHRGSELYVNQFIASTLDWKSEGLALEQTTAFPREQGTTLRITEADAKPRTIHIRIPGWTTGDAAIRLNGRPLEAISDPGSYVAIRRVWKPGDTIALSLPMTLRQEPLAGSETLTAALYGPLVLAANLGAGPSDDASRIVRGRGTAPDKLPEAAALPKAAAKPGAPWIEVESAADLRFKAATETAKLDVLPMYQVNEERYSVYWKVQDGKS